MLSMDTMARKPVAAGSTISGVAIDGALIRLERKERTAIAERGVKRAVSRPRPRATLRLKPRALQRNKEHLVREPASLAIAAAGA
eukprot:6660586-Prymnesium_polylepis.1